MILQISDVDFDNMEMDKSITNQSESKAKLWKEKKNDTVDDDAFAKVWDKNFCSNKSNTPIKSNGTVNSLSFPTTNNSSGDKVFRFFWWDAFEDPYKQPGVVYLFGKVYVDSLKEYVSCCVAVKNIPRRVYLLPREYVSFFMLF